MNEGLAELLACVAAFGQSLQPDRRDGRHKIRLKIHAVWLLLIPIVAGCAGRLEPGRLPTAEERCGFQGGTFSAGICRTRGGP